MADLEFWAQIMAQPGGYGRLQELVDDDERMKRQLTDAMGYLRCNDEIAGDLVKNILLSLDSNSACREGTSREARAVIRRTIDDDAFIAVLKVHAELGRSGLPVRLWSRPPNVAAPARLRAVERLANPSDDELWKYVATNTPCVVERAFEDMPCLQTFRDDDHLGARRRRHRGRRQAPAALRGDLQAGRHPRQGDGGPLRHPHQRLPRLGRRPRAPRRAPSDQLFRVVALHLEVWREPSESALDEPHRLAVTRTC